jgi:hypothetical protein
VFNSHYSDRIKEWKEYREQLETSNDPLQDVAEFWALAPFVNSYLNPNNSKEWPDPWKLILDGKYDDLAIVLGMLYTIKLTQRFMDTPCEIHMSMPTKEKQPVFFLVVAHTDVLNYEYRRKIKLNDITQLDSNIIWQGQILP